MEIGEHKRIWEYDGAFKCLDCQESWGVLSYAPPNPPDRCVPKPPDWDEHKRFREYAKGISLDVTFMYGDYEQLMTRVAWHGLREANEGDALDPTDGALKGTR